MWLKQACLPKLYQTTRREVAAMTPLVFASFGFSWLWIASAGDLCSSMETEGQSGCSNGKGIGAALIQRKVHGSMQVVADEVDRNSKETTLGHALQLVTQLVDKSGGHSWNMTADEKLAVETIRDMVQDLFNGSLIQHGEDQFEVDEARDRIQRCTDDAANTQLGAVTEKHNQADVSRNAHRECRERENKIIENTTEECRTYHSYRKNEGNFNPFPTCMSTQLTFDKIKTDNAVDKRNMEECLVKTVEMLRPLYHHYLGCKESNDLRTSVNLECDNKQREFEEDFCHYSAELDFACSTHDGCRNAAIQGQSRTHEEVKKAEDARKADWETAEHILCLIQVFEQDNSDKADQLNECMDASVDTSRIDIDYHETPAGDPCPGSWRTDRPCDDAWLETEYRSQTGWFNSTTINECTACITQR